MLKMIAGMVRVLPLLLLVMIISACSQKSVKVSVPPPKKTVKTLDSKRLKFSIQAGAFRNFKNAVNYRNRLAADADAYCFKDKDGLFKVRIGNFHSRVEARAKAEYLQSRGIIGSFFIFEPSSYSASKAPKKGGGYLRGELVQTAKRYLGVYYRWGGTSAKKGFDCSGLTMTVYRQNGLSLPRTAAQQYRKGRKVSVRKLSKGDLVFFSTGSARRTGRISHVGLYIGNGKFIHAPGRGKRVKVARLSNKYFKKHLVGAKTYM